VAGRGATLTEPCPVVPFFRPSDQGLIEPETRWKSSSHLHKIAIVTPARIESLLHAASHLTDAAGGVCEGCLRGSVNKGIAIYPGSFDPPTNGHLDLIQRGSKIFEELVVAILRNSEKTPMFSLAERLAMLRELTADLSNVRIDTFHGLMVEYAKSIEATCVLRGIRAVSDYEYELQMALMNRKIEPTLETVFMMPADKYSYVSSRLVREVAQLGGPVKGLVPEVVEQKLREKLDPAYKLQQRNVIEVPRRRKKKA
jgi:pantetheine-phosphate adenylyltransferase